MDPERVTYFGETDSRGNRVKFGIKAKDRTKHIYVIGKTGMGKSTLLENMAIQDLQNGEGMAFIDPHGSTAEKLLNYVPPERMNDVVYFAPFDIENPISFNVMEDVGSDKRHLVVAGLMSAFMKLFGEETFSDRMQYILQNTILALLEYPGATMLGINRMLTDKAYRSKVVANVTDASVKSYWTQEFANYTERFAQEATPAIQNKIGQFTSNPLIRNIIGQPKSSFDFRKIMDEKKIFIVNLSKGRVGEANANLLGSMIITKLYLAAMSRADVLEKDLKKLPNFYLYVDEFQSFANKSFADILSEARKYKLNLTIANQYIDQMAEEVRSAVFGNVGTMITFRVGAYDAEVLEKEFAPQFTAEDLVNLGMFQMYLKLMIDAMGSVPFSASSLPPFPEPVISYKSEIIANSRRQFAQPKMMVEEAIQRWHEEGKTADSQKKTEKTATKGLQPQTQPKSFNENENGSSSSGHPFLQNKSIKDVAEKSPVSTVTNNIVNNNVSNPIVTTTVSNPINISVAENSSHEDLRTKNKNQFPLPPIESEPGDGFLPLNEVVKKIIIEEKKDKIEVKKKEEPHKDVVNGQNNKNQNYNKIPNKQNLSDLKSALESVLKTSGVNNIKEKEKTNPVVSEKKISNTKVIDSKTESKEDTKPIINNQNNNKQESPKEISETELKKVLGIE